MAAMMADSSGVYPVQLDISYPETLSRITFLKWILAVPQLFVLYALNIVWEVLSFIAFFAILITGAYPEALFKFNYGIVRWQANVTAYMQLMRDEYPPFSLDAGQYPVTISIATPTNLNRWAPLYKWILAIPHFIILSFLGFLSFFVVIYAGIMVLISGKYPESAFKFILGVQRWSLRATTYTFFMHDEYPPFSMD